MKEYYTILGLNEGSSKNEIKKAYRELSKKYHPDRNPNNKEAETNFKKITEAYEIITGKQKPKNKNPFSGNPFSGNPFGNVRTPKPRPIKLIIEITLEEAYHGAKKIINFNIKDICYKCGGNGGFNPHNCNQCGGSGFEKRGPFTFMCNNCNGNGKLFKKVCYTCNGSRSTAKVKTIEADIPKGTTQDTIFMHKGIGDYINSNEKSDVYFIIKIKPHKIYVLDGLNLKRKLEIPIIDVILGTEKEFQTLGGNIKIKIPKLSKLDTTFRLVGKGFVDNDTKIAGDLYVTIDPKIPKKLSKLEENKLNELKISPNFNN